MPKKIVFREVVLSEFKQTSAEHCMLRKTQYYVHAFVYTPDKFFVVKGMEKEVETYIHQHCARYVKNTLFFLNTLEGKKRLSNWQSNLDIKIRKGRKNKYGRRGYNITVYDVEGVKHELFVRRVPHRWISLYNMARDMIKAHEFSVDF